jgi:hypothetical protein
VTADATEPCFRQAEAIRLSLLRLARSPKYRLCGQSLWTVPSRVPLNLELVILCPSFFPVGYFFFNNIA